MNSFTGFRGPAEVPGVFESVARDPALNGDPVAGVVGGTGAGTFDSRPAPAAMASRYTLRQTTPIGQSPAPGGEDANISAVAMITGGDAFNGMGATSGAGGTSQPGAILSTPEQAALGLDQTRRQFATADALRLMQRNGAIVNDNDAPEIRANKLGYYEKLLNRGAGGAPSRQLATTAARKVTDALRPQPKSTAGGPETSPDGRFYRSSPQDEWHPASEKKNDEKALTAQELQAVSAIQQSGRDLDSLEEAFTALGDADYGGPLMGRIKALNPADPNISRITNLIAGATPNLARGVFREVGVLTDEDIKRYQKLLPSHADTAAQRKQKFADLRTRLGQSSKQQLETLKAAGRDVDGLIEKLGTKEPPAGTTYKDADGKTYPIREIAGRGRGIIKGGKFYPIVN